MPYQNSSLLNGIDATRSSKWSFDENKMFENAIAIMNLESKNLFENISLLLHDKTVEQIEEHYEALVKDINNIELGYVRLPDYEMNLGNHPHRRDKKKKKKIVRWTTEEHENFLVGLKYFGKGDWRSISRICVPAKTPAQVASHAQKYYIRLHKSQTTPRTGTSSSSQA